MKAQKEKTEKEELAFDVQMTMKALEFVRDYHGTNPILRRFSRRSHVSYPRWVPSPREVALINRMVTYTQREPTQQDSLGRRLREQDRADVPDSLEDPDRLQKRRRRIT